MSFRIKLDPFTRAQHDAITDIDLPSITQTDLAIMRALTNDYARCLPVVTPESVIPCPECDGMGFYLVGCMSPDDLTEQRCALCDGSGLLDIGDAPTIPLQTVRPT